MSRFPITRRELLRAAGAASALIVTGCKATETAALDGPPRPDGPRVVGGDATPAACDDDTADNILGPYYKEGAPIRDTLVEAADAGVRLALSGTVTVVGTCVPVEGATLDIWQADDAAVYDGAGFRFRGKVLTDAAGAWSLRTIIPGHYLNGDQFRPAHIHVRLTGPGIEELVTQLYFEGDPYNAIDPFIVPSLIMPVADDGAGGRVARFDFVMRPA